MKLKKYNDFLNEEYDHEDDESGNVILNVDGKKSTWYYLRDAIGNGLLEETFGFDDEMIEEMYGDDVFGVDDLIDTLEQDFEEEIDILIRKIEDGRHSTDTIDDIPSSITITGDEEDGEEDIDLSWSVN